MSKDYKITLLSKDDAGAELMVSRYKPFRLLALQTEPQCTSPSLSPFHSTLYLIRLITSSLWCKI